MTAVMTASTLRASPMSKGGVLDSSAIPAARIFLDVFVRRERLADPLRERFRGQLRVVALSAQLLDRDVARRVDLRPRDDPRRSVLVPDPDVLHLQVEERIAGLRDVVQVELVAEVRRV